MIRLTVSLGFLALLGGCASTGEWRSLRMDATSAQSFEESVVLFEQEAPRDQYQILGLVLADIERTGRANALVVGSAYTLEDYLAQVNGLTYEELLDLAQPGVEKGYWAVKQRRGAIVDTNVFRPVLETSIN